MSFFTKLFSANSLLQQGRENIKKIGNNVINTNINGNIVDNVWKSLGHPTCGVHLLYSANNEINSIHTGILKAYTDNKISGLLELSCSQEEYYSQMNRIVRGDGANYFSKYLPTRTSSNKPIALFIDEIDYLFRHMDNKKIESVLVGLAEDSVFNKKYITLVCTNCEDNYDRMIGWNGGAKIHNCIKTNTCE